MVILRDMVEFDIEDYVRWFTVTDSDCDWTDYDAPWEPIETTAEDERRAWTEYYEHTLTLRHDDADAVRWKFEIEADGIHIGWVSAYTDLGYLGNDDEIPAVGIDIPERKYRRLGYGSAALSQFIDCWKNKGYKSLYTQTWSGNTPMIKLAEKLGFREYHRVRGLRLVNGKNYDAITFRIDF